MSRNTRGGLSACPKGPVLSKGGAMSGQNSAEGIVAPPTRSKGPNSTNRIGAEVSMRPIDAYTKAEMPEQPQW